MNTAHTPLPRSLFWFPVLLVLCIMASGCRHRRVQAPVAPTPPEIEQHPQPFPAPQPEASAPATHTRVLSSETGMASWYGTPYHNAHGANGSVYNQNAMTAAHRTLPLGTVARVTNLATRQSVVVTITDRGPFVPGRMLDLSRAAALRVGVWRAGVARVRLDVLSMPDSAVRSDRWCVQIGVIRHQRSADKIRDHLKQRYPGASVIDFKGPTGYWVRIRPPHGSHHDAIEVARTLRLTEGEAYLVRLK